MTSNTADNTAIPTSNQSKEAQTLICAQNVGLDLRGKRILQDVNLQVSAGEFVTLIGPNGAGKTSLIRIMLGLLDPSHGKVHRSPKLRIGYMPQKLHVDENFPISVYRFLQLAKNDKVAIERALEEVDIKSLADTPLASVSGGEMQRVFLARAILRDPQLLVLDEPVQGVDVGGQTLLYKLISKIKDHYGCGILMVSHDLHLVVASTDTVVCLNQHVCCYGHPESVVKHPQYLSLFGESSASALAVYTHHHDHDHDIHGDVV